MPRPADFLFDEDSKLGRGEMVGEYRLQALVPVRTPNYRKGILKSTKRVCGYKRKVVNPGALKQVSQKPGFPDMIISCPNMQILGGIMYPGAKHLEGVMAMPMSKNI